MSSSESEVQNRKKLRIKDYDYSQNGCYFVTICTYNRQKLFLPCVITVGNALCGVPCDVLCGVPHDLPSATVEIVMIGGSVIPKPLR